MKLIETNRTINSHQMTSITILQHDEAAGETIKSQLLFVDLASAGRNSVVSRQLSLLEHVVVTLGCKRVRLSKFHPCLHEKLGNASAVQRMPPDAHSPGLFIFRDKHGSPVHSSTCQETFVRSPRDHSLCVQSFEDANLARSARPRSRSLPQGCGAQQGDRNAQARTLGSVASYARQEHYG